MTFETRHTRELGGVAGVGGLPECPEPDTRVPDIASARCLGDLPSKVEPTAAR